MSISLESQATLDICDAYQAGELSKVEARDTLQKCIPLSAAALDVFLDTLERDNILQFTDFSEMGRICDS